MSDYVAGSHPFDKYLLTLVDLIGYDKARIAIFGANQPDPAQVSAHVPVRIVEPPVSQGQDQ